MKMEWIKRVAVGVVAAAVLSVGTLTLQPTAYAAPANSGASIAYVDWEKIEANTAEYKKVQTTLATEGDTLQKEFDEKSVGLSDAAKKELFAQYQKRFSLKEREVLSQFKAKVDNAIKEVANAQGISVVIDKNNVFYGGKDLTDDVIQKLGRI